MSVMKVIQEAIVIRVIKSEISDCDMINKWNISPFLQLTKRNQQKWS